MLVTLPSRIIKKRQKNWSVASRYPKRVVALSDIPYTGARADTGASTDTGARAGTDAYADTGARAQRYSLF